MEGRIDAAQVEELSRVVTAATAGGRVVLDMSGVTYVDRIGIELLHALRSRGVDLRNCSTFVDALISAESK